MIPFLHNLSQPMVRVASATSDDAQSKIIAAFTALTNLGIAVGLSICTFFILLGGYKYMMARGNPIMMERARGGLEHAAIGFAIVLLAGILASLVKSVLQV